MRHILFAAKTAVETVVPAIQRLSLLDWDFSGTYTLEHLLSLSWVNTTPIPSQLALGLYLVRDFEGLILSGWTMDQRETHVATFRISQEIVAIKDVGRLWDDHIRRGIERTEASMGTDKSLEPIPAKPSSRKVFVVHGHDGEAKEAVARFLERLDLQPIILHEQANKGQTLIEKFEANSDVAFAVVLLTPDDEGRAVEPGGQPLHPRARQNVILELGFFFGKLSRARVCGLYRAGVELPSDMAGIVYIPYDEHGGWKMALAREVKAAGIAVDINAAA